MINVVEALAKHESEKLDMYQRFLIKYQAMIHFINLTDIDLEIKKTAVARLDDFMHLIREGLEKNLLSKPKARCEAISSDT